MENGLARLEPATGRFTSYDVLDGLAGNAIACILEDRDGPALDKHEPGLIPARWSARTFINYSELDGLPGNDLSGWNTCYESPRGEMFFGGFPGAVVFFPERLGDPPGSPAVVLTDFKLSGISVPITRIRHSSIDHVYRGDNTLSRPEYVLDYFRWAGVPQSTNDPLSL